MLAQRLLSGGEKEKTYVDDVFSAYTYTGNGSTQTITNGIDLAGKGGMVWVKSRDSTNIHNLWDPVRGLSAFLESNSTAAAVTQGSTSFVSSGFSFGTGGSVNNSGGLNYVSWTFRKAPKFFDVVTWTGNGVSGRAISHALGVKPGMMIVKKTNGVKDWYVWHRSLSSETSSYLVLNSTAAATSYALWITPPDAANFYVAATDDVNGSGQTYVAYLFAHDPDTTDGIIQCGSFTTDGSGNATVNLGWEPQYLMVKNTSSSAHWQVFDQSRGFPTDGIGTQLLANSAGLESSVTLPVNPTASGFRCLGLGVSNTYIYMAIRRPNKPPTTGTQVYNAIARTGTSAVAQVTGVGFPPDLIMCRGKAVGFLPRQVDKLRGASQNLDSSGTYMETSFTSGEVNSFDMDGVTLGNASAQGYFNTVGQNFINWFFKRAPGVFDIVCYTGTGVAKTEAHNLGVVPELMIVKSRSGVQNWGAYTTATGAGNYLSLNQALASTASLTAWNNTTPTASVFSIGANGLTNTNNETHVAYLFATKAGISKVGSYTGNGSSQTINCGFSTGARFIMIKRTDAAGDWFIWDTARGIVAGNDPHLSLNSTVAEVTTDDSIDPDTSGFIVNQVAATNINVTSATYIFLAFA